MEAEHPLTQLLIVDDSRAELLYLRSILESAGYAVSEACDGVTCLASLEGSIPDLIILDVVMPGIDGFELCSHIKAVPRWKEIPVIFLSSLDRGTDQSKAFDLGAADYVSKPIDETELLARIQTQLARADARRQRLALTDELEHRVLDRTAELRTLIDTLPDLVWMKNREGVYRECNRRFEQFFGATREQIIGRTDRDFLSPEQADFFRTMDNQAIQSGKQTVNEEEVTFVADGHREFLETIKTPVYGAGGELLGVLGIGRDITERKKSEENLLRSLDEKDSLIRELFHRTKNTLQLINAVVALKTEHAERIAPKALVKSVETRIRAISLVHDMLYENQNLSRIPIRDYVGEVSMMVLTSYPLPPGKVSLRTDVEDLSFLIDTAVPLGLMLVELISNSIDHAFPGDRVGSIVIELHHSSPGRNLLRYKDDGVGLPETATHNDTETLGMQLIHTLGEKQMNGAININGIGGFSFDFSFPDDLYEERI